MLAEARLQQLHAFVNTFSKEELVWINGYLSGLLRNGHQAPNQLTSPPEVAIKKITILYGTETGNARKLGNSFAASAKKRGITVKLMGLDQYRLTDLSKEEYLFVVISTQGEGEPPVAARKFFDYIHQDNLAFEQLNYAVLGLGDTSYPLFCKAAEDVDLRLDKLGAKKILPLQKCDVDYEADATSWLEELFNALSQTASTDHVKKPVAVDKKSSNKTYEGKITCHINLNDSRSSKETYHIEITTEDQPIYEPGDAIGIYPHNKTEVVNKILTITEIDEARKISTSRVTDTVRVLLTKHLGICYLSQNIVQQYAKITGTKIPDTRMDLLDLLRIYPVKNEAQFEKVIKILNPPTPRLYSIASSPTAHSNEIHLTVAKNIFEVNHEQRVGLCSEFLTQFKEGDAVNFYVHKNRSFKLPAPDKDIIMIGPGTGIAPFRSFIAERDAIGASGRNWLFFGDRNFTTDFLYQTEWQQHQSTGVLTKINLAWSRDRERKHYVQHEIKKETHEFLEWIDNGAYVYICGNKDPMSTDVEETILQLLCEARNISREESIQLLDELNSQGRYVKDVY
jgi:sulfite reductase (NADPH) flavoprotein alpha-component